MSRYINEKELAALIRFADDDRENIDPSLIEALNNLHAAVMRNTARRLAGAQKRNQMLKERLCREHPVATEYGPMFWSVYKKINPSSRVPYEAWKELCEKNAGIAAYCRNAAQKYYDTKCSELEESFKKSKPYQKASKEYNFGKWNKEISDQDIYEWRTANT